LPGEKGLLGKQLLGLHVGLQLADLGQFVRRGTDDKLDDVTWSDFISPGLELSLLLASWIRQ